MLRLSQLKLPHKYKFFFKLFLCSSCIHVIICFILFFFSGFGALQTLVEVHSESTQAVVRMISFNKPKQSKFGLGSKKGKISQPGQKVKNCDNSLKGLQKKSKTTLGKSITHKIVQKNSTKKIVQKPAVQKAVITKSEPKTVEETRVVPEKKVIEQEVIKPIEQIIQKPTSLQDVIDDQEIEYLTPKEYEQALIQDVLKQAVTQVWAPPVGMNQNLSCQVLITVGFDGAILATEIEKKSGVLIYDIAVEQAVSQVVMPRQLWGKKVTIVFKP